MAIARTGCNLIDMVDQSMPLINEHWHVLNDDKPAHLPLSEINEPGTQL